MLRPLLAALALSAGGCSGGSSPQPPSNITDTAPLQWAWIDPDWDR